MKTDKEIHDFVSQHGMWFEARRIIFTTWWGVTDSTFFARWEQTSRWRA